MTSAIETVVTKVLSNNDDAELADAVRALVRQAIDVAEDILTYGTAADQLVLTRMLVGKATALLGTETTSHYESLRTDFQTLMTDIRGSEQVIDAAEPAALPVAVPTDDPDERPDD